METEVGGGSRAGEGGRGLVLNGDRVSIWQGDKSYGDKREYT